MSDKQITSPELIERIYDVAVDPSRLEELIDLWEDRIAPLRIQGSLHDENSDPTFAHFSRMGLFLDRLQFSDPQDIINEVNDAGALAAIVVSANLDVQQANDAAMTLFDLKLGDKFNGVSPDIGSQEALNHAVAKAIQNPSAQPEFLRFRLTGNDRFIVVRVRGLQKLEQNNKDQVQTHGLETKFGAQSLAQTKLALIVTTELAWQPQFGHAIQNAFELTTSETEIVRALIEGNTLDAIAEARGRSKATVRTQIRSIFEKTETRSQAELVRISLSLMDMVAFTEQTAKDPTHNSFATPSLSPMVFHTITRPDSRRLDHLILGDQNGKPLLYFPGDFGLARWPASAEVYAKEQGIKVIVPVRAGYGHSTQLPVNVNYQDAISDDFVALLDHHKIDSCPVLCHQSDFCLAAIFAARNLDRVSTIIGFTPMLPLWKRDQYERMDKWYKFILANARYAPKILPYLVKAGFYLALSVGQKNFMNSIHANNKADRDTFATPEVFEAMVTGSSIALSKEYTAHKVFAREILISASPDWVNDLEALKGKIPIHAHMGISSPLVPTATLVECQERYDWINFYVKQDAGELIFFKHWREMIDFTLPHLK